jgi:hypothetical protein
VAPQRLAGDEHLRARLARFRETSKRDGRAQRPLLCYPDASRGLRARECSDTLAADYRPARSRPMTGTMLWVVLLLVVANLVVALPFADAAVRDRHRRRQ